MAVKTLPRVFRFGNLTLEDPNPEWSPEDVKEHYANVYQDLTQATIDGPETTEDALAYEFERVYGTKGITVQEIVDGVEPHLEVIALTEQQTRLMKAIGMILNDTIQSPPILPPSEAQGMV